MNEWSENIVRLSDIRAKKLNALSPYGPVRAGLITSRITRDRALSELLNDLERRILDLEFRFSRVFATSLEDTILPAVRLLSIINTDTTEK